MSRTPPYIIASYPRSGSTWFRFVLAHVFYENPEKEHGEDVLFTFNDVNCLIPPIDHGPGVLDGIFNPRFYKSHALHQSSRIIYLHRHVGDVLISEWWYKKKFHGESRSIESYLLDVDYGREWRAHVNHYFPQNWMLSYDELSLPQSYLSLGIGIEKDRLERALRLCSFAAMQKEEEQGFGKYPSGDLSIRFVRRGKSQQWRELPDPCIGAILEKNAVQLRLLGYL